MTNEDKKQHMIALIDCNNFFVSCERLFRPDLINKPVVVLSSNDGCAVSRSQEVKDLGMPMGAPIYKYREVVEKYGIVSFSANFELYGDISRRISTLLTSITPALELYSIDEAFVDLSKLAVNDYAAWGKAVRERIAIDIGIPVSIGIAPNKTLAKLANHKAKKLPRLQGVLCINGDTATAYLKTTHVRDVWGVGRKLAPKLLIEGISTAYDLAHMNPKHAQSIMGINGRIMAAELLGDKCLQLQQQHKPQKMIMRGRQFGADTAKWSVIEAAVATLTSRACLQLRRDNQLATKACVVLRTNWRKSTHHTLIADVVLREPSADTGVICSQIMTSLSSKHRRNHKYHKADVYLFDFVRPNLVQLDLFGRVKPQNIDRQSTRMATIDTLNSTHKPTTVRYAAEKLSDAWTPRKNYASPRYTSAWLDIPEATLQN